MNKTPIEYLDYTWNPIIMRCTPVSEGCAHCWAIQRAKMLAGNPMLYPHQRHAYAGNAAPCVSYERLQQVFHRKKPSIIGVQFMGDLFHESVSNESIARVFNAMYQVNWHTFMLLTKRPHRMRDWFSEWDANDWKHWPNLWLGITVENQQRADERIPILHAIPGKHWISYEPVLGLVDFDPWLDRIDYLVAGGETGPGARPCHPSWIRSVRDQCASAGVPFMFKSWGGKRRNESMLDGKFHLDMPKGDK